MPVPLFPATSRLLPGTRCTLFEAVCELSRSGCGLIDAALGNQGIRSAHPGTVGCFTAPVPKLPASTGELLNAMGLLRYTANAFPWTLHLCVRTGRFLLDALRFQLGQGKRDRVSGCEGTVRATGFVGTMSKFPRTLEQGPVCRKLCSRVPFSPTTRILEPIQRSRVTSEEVRARSTHRASSDSPVRLHPSFYRASYALDCG